VCGARLSPESGGKPGSAGPTSAIRVGRKIKQGAVMHQGSCLCGSVRFHVNGSLGAPVACHCVRCRKQSGHFFASANVPKADLQFSAQDQLKWYQSSAKVRRGFCSQCGSWLFWDPPARDWISIAMGAFDADTGTRLERHIFVAEKGDYYDIADGLPQNEH
jgi:hypothetical protein